MTEPPAEHEVAPEPVKRPDHHGSGVEHPVDKPKPKKTLLGRLVRIVLVLFVLAVLLAALAPMLLSTGPGTRWVASMVSDRLPGDLLIEDLSLSWFGGQRAEGISYNETTNGLVVQVGTIDAAEVGLFDLLTGSRRFSEVVVEDVDILMIAQDKSAARRDQTPTVKQAKDASPLKLPRGLSVTLTVRNLNATYQPIMDEPIWLTLDEDQIVVTDLRDIRFGMDASIRQGVKRGRVSLTGDIINLFDPDGVEQAGRAAYDIMFDVQNLPTAALDQIVSGLGGGVEPGQLLALLGEGEFVSTATLKGTIDQLASDLSITAPKLRVELDQRAEDNTLIATPESYAWLDLDQVGFEALFPESGLKLHKPTRIDLASVQMALPIVDKAVDWDKATAALLLKAGDDLALVDERGEVLGINDLRVTGRSDSIADKLSFKLTTNLSAVDSDSNVTTEPIAVDLTVYEPLQATRKIDFFSEKLPIRLADALTGQDGRLVLWLDEALELQADMRGTIVTDAAGDTTIEQRFMLRPSGRRVNGTVSGSYARDRFTLATPAGEPVEAVMSPQAFASLMELLSGIPGQPALTIDQDMPVYLTVRNIQRGDVSIAIDNSQQRDRWAFFDLEQTYVGAVIELTPARVYDPVQNATYDLRGGTLTLNMNDLSRPIIDIAAELNLWVRPDAGKEGVAALFTWQTTVSNVLDTQGGFPLDGKTLMQQISAVGGVQLKNAPSGLFDSLLNRNGDLASILGPFVQQMQAGFTYKDGQPTGASVRLNWDEANSRPLDGVWASMKPAQFDIDDQQMLTIRGGEDLELEVRVSPGFGDRWMGKLHPILFDAKSGDRPVKIKVDGKSFRFPLQGESMKGARVEASVDLGTIAFGDDALLGKIMEWTGRPGEHAIFEPARVKLVDGNISYDQFDLAVGNVKLRLDGEVDLASGQIVDMAVRVPGDSLIRVFNELEGVIPPDDYLSIPMTGAIREPEFDSQLIGREVARLLTRGLIEKQKDELKDLIREGIGDDDEPAPDDEKDPEDEVADELIDRGLDLLFRRLGGDKDKQD